VFQPELENADHAIRLSLIELARGIEMERSSLGAPLYLTEASA
jgi:hypothetical protein